MTCDYLSLVVEIIKHICPANYQLEAGSLAAWVEPLTLLIFGQSRPYLDPGVVWHGKNVLLKSSVDDGRRSVKDRSDHR